jgi:hypothetical protein
VPMMLAASWFVCRWCVDRLHLRRAAALSGTDGGEPPCSPTSPSDGEEGHLSRWWTSWPTGRLRLWGISDEYYLS